MGPSRRFAPQGERRRRGEIFETVFWPPQERLLILRQAPVRRLFTASATLPNGRGSVCPYTGMTYEIEVFKKINNERDGLIPWPTESLEEGVGR